MIKGTIYEEDRHHKPLDAEQQRNKRYVQQKSEEIQGKRKKYMIRVRHINISLNILSGTEKNKNRSILTDVINNLNRIYFYLY